MESPSSSPLVPAAFLVRDSREPDSLHFPPEWPAPAPHQCQGSPLDNLAEVAGRGCYNSLGNPSSRGSQDYHTNIAQVGHRSIYEHCAFTVEVSERIPLTVFLNRPSLWVGRDKEGEYRVTLNVRHVKEWYTSDAMSEMDLSLHEQNYLDALYLDLLTVAQGIAPLSMFTRLTSVGDRPCQVAWKVAPKTPHEIWYTFWISGVSRVLTHELVRHGDWTAISQESGRFCDVSNSPIAWHPTLLDYPDLIAKAEFLTKQDRNLYQEMVKAMTANGASRKTARGAARGVLPFSGSTHLIWSCSQAQLTHVLAMRGAPDADEEIQLLSAALQAAIDKQP